MLDLNTLVRDALVKMIRDTVSEVIQDEIRSNVEGLHESNKDCWSTVRALEKEAQNRADFTQGLAARIDLLDQLHNRLSHTVETLERAPEYDQKGIEAWAHETDMKLAILTATLGDQVSVKAKVDKAVDEALVGLDFDSRFNSALNKNFAAQVDTAIETYDFSQIVNAIIDDYDIDDKIESAIDDYDMSGKIESAIGDYDFDDKMNSAIEDFDMDRKIESALDGYDFAGDIESELESFDFSDKIKEELSCMTFESQINAALREMTFEVAPK